MRDSPRSRRLGSDLRAMQGLQAQPLFRYDMTVVARRGHPRADAQSERVSS